MNEPLTPERLAHARDLCGKASPGPWSVPHLSKPEDDPTKCRCPYVLSEGYFGSICDISVDNGLKVSDGGNDSPPLEEARANGELIGIGRELIPDLLEDHARITAENILLRKQRDYLVQRARIPAIRVYCEFDSAGDTTTYAPDQDAADLFGDDAMYFVIGCGPTPTHYSLITKEIKP